jgi:hypothetical protein
VTATGRAGREEAQVRPGPPGAAAAAGTDDGVDPSAAYLLARLGLLESRVRALVSHRREGDPAADDAFRGLYVSDDHVDTLLARPAASRVLAWDDGPALAALEGEADELERAGTPIRLRALARRAGLDRLDVDLVLAALAPDLDARFERLYGYLNDDVSRRRASVGLALELAGQTTWSAVARSRLAPAGPAVAAGLVTVEDPDRPVLTRALRVPDRVAAYLLGDDTPDRAVAGLLATPGEWPADAASRRLAAAVAAGANLVYVREHPGASAAALAAAALAAAPPPVGPALTGAVQSGAAQSGAVQSGAVLTGSALPRSALPRSARSGSARERPAPLVVDLAHLAPGEDPSAVVRLARREALLAGSGLVLGPVEALAERSGAGGPAPGAVAAALGGLLGAPGGPVALHGRGAWEPGWSHQVPLLVEADAHPPRARAAMWRAQLAPSEAADELTAELAGQFLLSCTGVTRAVESARLQAALDGGVLGAAHLRGGARAQNGAGLERLARRIVPAVSWPDLVLAPVTRDGLADLAARARGRARVLDEWGMRPGGGRGRGITALLAGDSGTGKTMSAEVVAGDLGLDLYTVNLATVVDKYVGETEKNLERIFTEADGVNAVLLFDEADAIFGKRSEVKDANDRYANIEVAYLLQRMETFDGIALLATNLAANVDEAFARRLDLVIDFPNPDPDLRRQLWERALAPAVPRSDDIDLDFLAGAFELSGGNIRSIAVTAAYAAADKDEPVGMIGLVAAVAREYRKLGRLVVAGEFGPYFERVSSP